MHSIIIFFFIYRSYMYTWRVGACAINTWCFVDGSDFYIWNNVGRIGIIIVVLCSMYINIYYQRLLLYILLFIFIRRSSLSARVPVDGSIINFVLTATTRVGTRAFPSSPQLNGLTWFFSTAIITLYIIYV